MFDEIYYKCNGEPLFERALREAVGIESGRINISQTDDDKAKSIEELWGFTLIMLFDKFKRDQAPLLLYLPNPLKIHINQSRCFSQVLYKKLSNYSGGGKSPPTLQTCSASTGSLRSKLRKELRRP
jgi:hypothetical protein